MTDKSIMPRDLAKTLWAYNTLNQKIRSANFIFVMCSYNLLVADRAYELFQNGMGTFIVVSGGVAHQDDLLNTGWDKPEAQVFQQRLLDLGMTQDQIYVEDQAQNCGENIVFTKQLMIEKEINLQSGIIVQKPYMERRAFAVAEKQWAEVNWQVTSPFLSYDEYIEQNNEERLINILVGDTQRIINYADKGFQTAQHMPKNILDALNSLKDYGFTKHL